MSFTESWCLQAFALVTLASHPALIDQMPLITSAGYTSGVKIVGRDPEAVQSGSRGTQSTLCDFFIIFL